MNKEILMIAQAISNEKGVDPEIIFEAIETALAFSTKKRFDIEVDIRVAINPDKGEFSTFRRWLIIDNERTLLDEDIQLDDELHILPRDSRLKNKELNPGEYYEEEIENAEFGRIAAQMSKQIIMQKIRVAERNKIIEEYIGREGQMVKGTVKKASRDYLIVDLGGNADGFLSRSNLIDRETFNVNDRIRAIVTEVNAEARGPQISLSRIAPVMVTRMFELEVPEVAEQIISICKVAREPGIRAKIAVRTNDTRIDPVGACVGMRGARVQAVSNELNGERIDIIPWDDDPGQFVINVLAPAEVDSIVIDEESHSMDIAVAVDSLAQAIGRNGQNVRLTTQLTGWNINIMSIEDATDKQAQSIQKDLDKLVDTLDIDTEVGSVLIQEGFSSVEEIADSTISELASIDGFDDSIAEELTSRAKDALLALALSGDINTPQPDLLAMEGMTEELAYKLAKLNICTKEDLAEQAVDDLMDIDLMDEKLAGELIMTARQHWFE